jgi:predicted transposase/invertase (TIGR01784 family)
MQDINPRVDIAFQKIFGVEENKDLLISLINSIVGKEDQLNEVTMLNPYNPKSFRRDKLSILDIKASSQTGKRYNIEIQITDEGNYDKRALYYWAKLYTQQLKHAEDYSILCKAIGIHILNFDAILTSKQYHNSFHIVEKDKGFLYFEDLELHTIELKKFSNNTDESLEDILKKVKTSLDRWIAFLTRHELLKGPSLPEPLDDPSLKKAVHVLGTMNFTDEERELYEQHLKWLRMEANALKKQEEKGRQKGLKQGIEKGRKEEKLKLAKTMLIAGYKADEIAKLTGLSINEIESI